MEDVIKLVNDPFIKRAFQVGQEEGIEKGIERGIERGKIEGKREGRMELLSIILQQGKMSKDDFINKLRNMGINENEIKSLVNEKKN